MSHKQSLTGMFAGMAMFAATVVVSFGGPAWAQTAAQSQTPSSMNIRVVSIENIRSKSTAFIAARKEIVAYANSRKQTLQAEDKALRDAGAELNRKRTLLSPEAFADERKKFEQRVAAFQRTNQDHQKATNKLQREALGKVNDKILQIITEYAKDNAVSLILPAQSVLLRADYMDMDGLVLERLNKELPSVTVSLPTQ